MAKRIPGKHEFNETLRYFNVQMSLAGVDLRLNTNVEANDLNNGDYDEVVIATGVLPRQIQLEGIEHPSVLLYTDVLAGNKPVGDRVAIIGAGGIGFDVAEFLTDEHIDVAPEIEQFMNEWGVDQSYEQPGALKQAAPAAPAREVYLLQRSTGKLGARLGKTTGWIHRSSLKMKKVNMLSNVQYQLVDDKGLHITVSGKPMILEVDNVIICAGQEPLRTLYDQLKDTATNVHLIGGAEEAKELDAKRAIGQGYRLAISI